MFSVMFISALEEIAIFYSYSMAHISWKNKHALELLRLADWNED